MKRYAFRNLPLSFLIVFLAASFSSYGQNDTLAANEDYNFKSLAEVFRPAHYDINRTPINICFLTNNGKYTGFVIAGHASKSICEVASLGVKNFLDSLGYHNNTIFSFGVGVDINRKYAEPVYHTKLEELKNIFTTLEKKDPYQVKVTYASELAYNTVVNKIRENMTLGYRALNDSDSANRIIFRYQSIPFPVVLPFYKEDSIAKFEIPKKQIGAIPDIKKLKINLIRQAVREADIAIKINKTAIDKLNAYNPVITAAHPDHKIYPIIVSTGLRQDTLRDLVQIDTNKVVEEYEVKSRRTTRFYTLTELRRFCEAGQTVITLKTIDKKPIYTCAAVANDEATIKKMISKKQSLLSRLTRINNSLKQDRDKLSELLTKFTEVQSAEDTLIAVDAFLRGWPFEAANPVVNAQLEKWYAKRGIVWASVLEQYPAYKSRLATKKKVTDDANAIAGIFHYDDVFFSVKDGGDKYMVTPYKLLSGEFIQVLDRNSPICQFVTTNNFRLIKL
jgi:hypothetical protein